MKAIAFVLLLFALVKLPAEGASVIYSKDDPYPVALLSRVMDLTVATYGKTELVPYPEKIAEERLLILMEEGKVDVSYFVEDGKRDKKVLPVPVEIMKGIQGCRICLVHVGSAADFGGVSSLADLRKYKAGFGEQWADLAILQANGIPVVTANNTMSLCLMLDRKRFDYFPRSLNEIWRDYDGFVETAPGIAVDMKVALYYPIGVRFCVRKGNSALASRIAAGLKLALADGSMKKLFMDSYKPYIDRAKLEGRTIIFLRNPALEDDSDIDTSWWLPKKVSLD